MSQGGYYVLEESEGASMPVRSTPPPEQGEHEGVHMKTLFELYA